MTLNNSDHLTGCLFVLLTFRVSFACISMRNKHKIVVNYKAFMRAAQCMTTGPDSIRENKFYYQIKLPHLYSIAFRCFLTSFRRFCCHGELLKKKNPS